MTAPFGPHAAEGFSDVDLIEALGSCHGAPRTCHLRQQALRVAAPHSTVVLALNMHGVHIPLTVIVIARVNITYRVICMDSAVIVTNRNY